MRELRHTLLGCPKNAPAHTLAARALLFVLVQGKWTNRDSWFAAVFASAVMAMVIDHYVNHIN
jgi:hypothetical protein